MLAPPFKLAPSALGAGVHTESDAHVQGARCCGVHDDAAAAHSGGRTRLAQLDAHLHCSVIGTCLSTGELRGLMSASLRFAARPYEDVRGDTVRLISQNGEVAKAVHKALDQRHEAVVRRLSKAHDSEALAVQWQEALHQGEIPGAYWAVLDTTAMSRPNSANRCSGTSPAYFRTSSARRIGPTFGDWSRSSTRTPNSATGSSASSPATELVDERDLAVTSFKDLPTAARTKHVQTRRAIRTTSSCARSSKKTVATRSRCTTNAANEPNKRPPLPFPKSAPAEELDHLKDTARGAQPLPALPLKPSFGKLARPASPRNDDLDRQQLREKSASCTAKRPAQFDTGDSRTGATTWRRFQRHDGGLEDRKGLLASAISWAEVVVFPVDCVDLPTRSRQSRLRLRARQDVAFPSSPAQRKRGEFAAAFTARASRGGDLGPAFEPHRLPSPLTTDVRHPCCAAARKTNL